MTKNGSLSKGNEPCPLPLSSQINPSCRFRHIFFLAYFNLKCCCRIYEFGRNQIFSLDILSKCVEFYLTEFFFKFHSCKSMICLVVNIQPSQTFLPSIAFYSNLLNDCYIMIYPTLNLSYFKQFLYIHVNGYILFFNFINDV